MRALAYAIADRHATAGLCDGLFIGFLIMPIGSVIMDCDDKKIWKTAIYVRLSREDGDKAESESIKNQRDLIRAFMSDKPDLLETRVYEDDGYSGVNMERPAFQKMMDDIRDNKIDCIVLKDLSRLGRNCAYSKH